MNRTSVFLYLIFALFSCSNVRRTYYPTGELKEEYVRIDDSTEKYTKYYKNGQNILKANLLILYSLENQKYGGVMGN